MLCFYLLFSATFVNSISDDEEVSDNEASDSDDIDTKLPSHEFHTKEVIIKRGKNKGQKFFIVTLNIPPYWFKRRIQYLL